MPKDMHFGVSFYTLCANFSILVYLFYFFIDGSGTQGSHFKTITHLVINFDLSSYAWLLLLLFVTVLGYTF